MKNKDITLKTEKNIISKKNSIKEKKKSNENIFKKICNYFKGVVKEVKRIRWTSGKDLMKYSIATVIFVLFLGIYFYAVDWVALLVRSMAK